MVHHLAGDGDLGRHVCQPELHGLVIHDLGPEGLAFAGVRPGEFERRYRTFFGPKADPALVDSVVASALKTPIEVASAELMGLATTDTAALARQVTAPVLWVTARPVDVETLQSMFADLTPAVAVGSR